MDTVSGHEESGRSLGAQEWIAVLDDNASVRNSLARLLRVRGLAVETFATPSEFLTANAVAPPALLVLDVHLGVANGFDLQAMLADSHPQLPVILVTGHDDIPAAELTRRTGPDGFLRKPFDVDVFIDMVRRRAGMEAEVR